jgi:hypothetical protein
MTHVQLDTKQDLISNIPNVGDTLTVNQFVDAAFHLLDTEQIDKKDLESILFDLFYSVYKVG